MLDLGAGIGKLLVVDSPAETRLVEFASRSEFFLVYFVSGGGREVLGGEVDRYELAFLGALGFSA